MFTTKQSAKSSKNAKEIRKKNLSDKKQFSDFRAEIKKKYLEGNRSRAELSRAEPGRARNPSARLRLTTGKYFWGG